MTVWQLIVHSCITYGSGVAGISGEYSTTVSCRNDRASLYATEEICNQAAAKAQGRPIYSDVADGRKADDASCSAVTVFEDATVNWP
jgi:hypothetical protein